MAKKLFDLTVKTGSYTNRDGEEKGRYKNVGVVMEGNDGGMFLLLDRTFNPAGVGEGETCLVSMFEPKPRQQSQQHQEPQAGYGTPADGPPIDDSIVPF